MVRRGSSWRRACENEEIKSKLDDDDPDYLDVLDVDFWEWLKGKQRRPRLARGKRPRIKVHLAEMFPDGVPEPAHCNRQTLQGSLINRDKTLAPLDLGTLKDAIDEYNQAIGNDR